MMNRSKPMRLFPLLFLCAPALLFGCGASYERGGLALTFDDTHIDQWFDARDLFATYDARVTFSVTKPHQLSAEQFEKLRTLQSEGHEIANHTLNHVHVPAYIEQHGVEAFLEDEIRSASAILEAEGIRTTSFTYPSGRRNEHTDAVLLEEFEVLRSSFKEGSKPLRRLDEIYHTPERSNVVYGAGIDAAYGVELSTMEAALKRAARRGEIVSLYAHRIKDRPVEADELAISRDQLELLLATAKEEQLRFVTLSEVAQGP